MSPQARLFFPVAKLSHLSKTSPVQAVFATLLFTLLAITPAGTQSVAIDAGPRGGAAAAGGAFAGLNGGPGLNAAEQAFFDQVFQRFLVLCPRNNYHK